MRFEIQFREIRRQLLRFVRKQRIRGQDAEDLVQDVFEVLAEKWFKGTPITGEGLAAWLKAVAGNIIANQRRRYAKRQKLRREAGDEAVRAAGNDTSTGEPSYNQIDWAWLVSRLPKSQKTAQTLEWLKRRFAGESCESIAQSDGVSVTTVRKRLNRLERSLTKLAKLAKLGPLAAFIGLIVTVMICLITAPRVETTIVPDTARAPRAEDSPRERAYHERDEGLVLCDAKQWHPCLEKLDRASALFPDIAADARVQSARSAAVRALSPEPHHSERPVPPSNEQPAASTVALTNEKWATEGLREQLRQRDLDYCAREAILRRLDTPRLYDVHVSIDEDGRAASTTMVPRAPVPMFERCIHGYVRLCMSKLGAPPERRAFEVRVAISFWHLQPSGGPQLLDERWSGLEGEH